MAENPVTKEEFIAWVGECWDKTTQVAGGVGVPLIVRQDTDGPVIAMFGPGSESYPANAALMAASPFLLSASKSALEELESFDDTSGGLQETIAQLRHAILQANK